MSKSLGNVVDPGMVIAGVSSTLAISMALWKLSRKHELAYADGGGRNMFV